MEQLPLFTENDKVIEMKKNYFKVTLIKTRNGA